MFLNCGADGFACAGVSTGSGAAVKEFFADASATFVKGVLENAFRMPTCSCSSTVEGFSGGRVVVLAAVTQQGHDLRFASQELVRDREGVLAAVGLSGYALRYASRQVCTGSGPRVGHWCRHPRCEHRLASAWCGHWWCHALRRCRHCRRQGSS